MQFASRLGSLNGTTTGSGGRSHSRRSPQLCQRRGVAYSHRTCTGSHHSAATHHGTSLSVRDTVPSVWRTRAFLVVLTSWRSPLPLPRCLLVELCLHPNLPCGLFAVNSTVPTARALSTRHSYPRTWPSVILDGYEIPTTSWHRAYVSHLNYSHGCVRGQQPTDDWHCSGTSTHTGVHQADNST